MTGYKYNIEDVVKVEFDGNGKTDSHGLVNEFSKGDIFKIFKRKEIVDGGLTFFTYYGEYGGKSGWCPEDQLVLVGSPTDADSIMISRKEIDDGFKLIEKNQAHIKELLDKIEMQLKEHKRKFPGS